MTKTSPRSHQDWERKIPDLLVPILRWVRGRPAKTVKDQDCAVGVARGARRDGRGGTPRMPGVLTPTPS